ncbi:hypothetical protein KKH56_01755 [bacterium]|nr:hypothetical protein [bacterium]
MRIKRYEILLPLVYNDGKEIEKEKFFRTDQELVEKFGATTTDTTIAIGSWVYKGVLYKDRLIRIRVDVEDTEDARKFLEDFKEVLKERFKQIDIWITGYDIEVI